MICVLSFLIIITHTQCAQQTRAVVYIERLLRLLANLPRGTKTR